MADVTVNKTYKAQVEQIHTDAHDNMDSSMLPVYKAQKAELNSLHSFIGMLFIKYSTKGLLDLTTVQKATITKQVTAKLITMGKNLNQIEINAVTNALQDVYKETYNKSAYILNQDFKKIDNSVVNDSVNTPTAGQTYPDRIIGYKVNTVNQVKAFIKTALLGAVTIDELGKQVQSRFEIQANETKCLADNETTRVSTDATSDIADDAGVDQVMWSATLESDTVCDECADLDGQVWDTDSDHPVPVESTHVNCRCCLIDIPYEGWTPVQSINNDTKELIDYTQYNDWKDGNSSDDSDD